MSLYFTLVLTNIFENVPHTMDVANADGVKPGLHLYVNATDDNVPAVTIDLSMFSVISNVCEFFLYLVNIL